MSEKGSKGTFLKPEKLQNHSNEGKGKEKKKERGEGKEEKKKKSIVALLGFVIATLEIGLFGDNVIKNPARYIVCVLTLSLLGVKKSLGHAQICLL